VWVTAIRKVCVAGVALREDLLKVWLCFKDLKAHRRQLIPWLSTLSQWKPGLGWLVPTCLDTSYVSFSRDVSSNIRKG